MYILGPTHAHGKQRIHGAGFNSIEWHGICMFEVPQVLLGERATTGSLPSLPIISKRRVTHYSKVTKKEKQTWPTMSTINQTNKVLLRAKMIHLCGVRLGLLPQISPSVSHLWVVFIFISIYSIWVALASISISSILGGSFFVALIVMFDILLLYFCVNICLNI